MFRIATTFFLFAVFFNTAAYSQNYWEFANSPRGGSVTFIGVHPSGDIMAVAQQFYTSSDNGATWSIVSSNKSYLGALLILPDGTMFNGIPYDGMYTSTDKGVTWSSVHSSISNQTYSCFARTATGTLYSGSQGSGIFKSTDNGANWNVQQNGLGSNSRNIRGMVFNPTSTNVFAATYEGIYKTTNNGTNWVVTSAPSKTYSCIVSDSSGTLFAGRIGGIIVSTDNGTTWTDANTGLGDTTVSALMTTSDGTVFAATNGGVFRSTNHGSSWTAQLNGLTGITVQSLGIKGSTIIAGTRAGVFTSGDNGDHWVRHIVGMKAITVQDPAQLDGGRVLLGLGEAGTYKTDDNGGTWTQITTNVPRVYISTTYRLGANTFLAGTYYGGIWKTTDNGDSWTYVALTGQAIPSIKKNSLGTLFAATGDGVRKSTDNGATWDSTGLKNEYLYDLVIDASDNIFVGSNHGIFESTDKGAHFTHALGDTMANGTPAFYIVQSLAIDAHGTMYNVIGYSPVASDKGLHVSTDGGLTWSHIATPDSNISRLGFSSTGDIYAGLRTGIMRSQDNATNWTTISSGLDSATSVAYIEFGPDGTTWLGTDHGVFRSIHSTTSVREQKRPVPISFTLGQNYPNPFNPMTNIDFTLTKQGYVTLKVFNVLGQEVASLVHETLKAGTYTATWIATDASSGSYYYTLSSGGQSVVKKLMLVK